MARLNGNFKFHVTNLELSWEPGEVVLLLLCAASPKASLLGRRASGTLGDTTRPMGPRSTQPQPPQPPNVQL